MNPLAILALVIKYGPTAIQIGEKYGPFIADVTKVLMPIIEKYFGEAAEAIKADLKTALRPPAQWTDEENERFWNRGQQGNP